MDERPDLARATRFHDTWKGLQQPTTRFASHVERPATAWWGAGGVIFGIFGENGVVADVPESECSPE